MVKIIKDEKVKGKHEKEEKDKIEKSRKEKGENKIKKQEIQKKYEQVKKYVRKINIMTDVSEKILNKIFWNVIKAVAIIVYFMILNIAYTKMQEARILEDTKIFAGVFLIAGLIELERAYKKDSGKIAVTALELIVLSLFTLSIIHISTLFKYDFRLYVVTFSYLFAIYYILKAILVYTKEKKEYLQSLSDISYIVKKDKPVKKEAKKRKDKVKKENKETKDEKEQAKTDKPENKKVKEHKDLEDEKGNTKVENKEDKNTENETMEKHKKEQVKSEESEEAEKYKEEEQIKNQDTEEHIENKNVQESNEKQIDSSESKEEVKVND